MTTYQTVAKVGDVAAGTSTTVDVGGKLIALFNHDGKYYAIDDVCPHMGASLADGHVEDGIVTCPWHAWRFKLCDGTWADSPRVKTGSYPVNIVEDTIQIELPET